MTFGRDEGDERFSGDRLMSARHLQVHFFEGDVLIEDLKSSNKTHINGRAIDGGVRVKLRKLDLIELGNQKFIFTEGHEIPPAYRERIARPVSLKAPAVPSVFESFFHGKNWDASTRMVGMFTFLIAVVFFLGYFPDFSSRNQLHSPHKIVAEILAVTCGVSFCFLFFHYWLATQPSIPRRVRFATALALGPVLGIAMFLVHSFIGVPRQLDQNRLARDCRKIVKAAHYEWCAGWVDNNKNQAFESLPLEMQAEIEQSLKSWVSEHVEVAEDTMPE